jgi:hypothetical protein
MSCVVLSLTCCRALLPIDLFGTAIASPSPEMARAREDPNWIRRGQHGGAGPKNQTANPLQPGRPVGTLPARGGRTGRSRGFGIDRVAIATRESSHPMTLLPATHPEWSLPP